MIDEKVRKTWQIPPERIDIKHPDWEKKLDAFVKSTVANRLGCEKVPITAHLYKMLLYEPDCHFLMHQDTEKEQGMFATMVIQLPSSHTGGELVVFDSRGEEIVHDMGQDTGMAPFNCHYAVHFADSHHKVNPIKSGYRLVLIYSICWPVEKIGSVPSRFTSHSDQTQDIKTELENWDLGDQVTENHLHVLMSLGTCDLYVEASVYRK